MKAVIGQHRRERGSVSRLPVWNRAMERAYLPACFITMLAFFGIAATVVQADPRSPYRAVVISKSRQDFLHAVHASEDTTGVRSIRPLSLTARVHSEGNVSVSLYLRKGSSWPRMVSHAGETREDATPLALFQGEARVRGVRYPAAASVVGKRVSITFPGRIRGRSSRQRVYTVSLPVDGAMDDRGVSVASSPAALFAGKVCGQESPGEASGAEVKATVEPLNTGLKAAKLYHVLTLSTEADAEMYARYGATTNSVIAGIVNTAEALFAQQVGIRFKVVRQHAYADLSSSPLTQTDPSALLRAFSNNSTNSSTLGMEIETFDRDVDLKHLFTGKDLDGTTVGLAYVGTVCSMPEAAYGLSQVTSTRAAPYFFAHEVGHNLGARHDPSGDLSSLMSPRISIGSSFSKLSIDQINEHLFYSGSCLDLVSQEELLSTAVISIGQRPSRNLVRVYGQLMTSSQSPLSGEGVRVVIGGRARRVVTDLQGGFSVAIKRSVVKHRATMYAVSEGGEVRSRTLKVR